MTRPLNRGANPGRLLNLVRVYKGSMSVVMALDICIDYYYQVDKIEASVTCTGVNHPHISFKGALLQSH